MFASMIFRKDPFFHGNSNSDQLVTMAQVLGTDDLVVYLERYKIELAAQYGGCLGPLSEEDLAEYCDIGEPDMIRQQRRG